MSSAGVGTMHDINYSIKIYNPLLIKKNIN